MAQPAHVEVTVLGCTSCGAPVPFGDADTLSCVYCGATVAVPEEHRGLRAAEREYNLHRSAAQAQLRRLGKTPPFWVRFLTNANGITVMWLVPLGTVLAGVAYAAAYSLVARLCIAVFHVHVDD